MASGDKNYDAHNSSAVLIKVQHFIIRHGWFKNMSTSFIREEFMI